MIHIVLFKFSAEKLAAEFPGNSLQVDLQAMAAKVPGLLDAFISEKNATPWEGYVDCAQGYTHCLISKHVDAAALKVYAEFPEHKALQARLAKCFEAPPLRMEMNLPPKL